MVVVSINLKSGTNLPPKDPNDPYTIITYPGHQLKTPIIKKSLNPVWDFQFKVEVQNIEDLKVHFEVWDKDIIGRDYMGETELTIPDDFMTSSTPMCFQLPLVASKEHEKEKVWGHLNVTISLHLSKDDMISSALLTKNSHGFKVIPHNIPSSGWEPRFADLAVDSKDRIIILDDLSGTVKIYDASGSEKLIEFACKASYPHITVDSSDNLYVADSDTMAPVKQYDFSGKLIKEIGEPAYGSEGISKVREVVVDDMHKLFLMISTNGLHFFSEQGKLQNTIKAIKDPEAGKFVAPKSVSVNSKGNIVVLDGLFQESCKLMVFDATGKFQFESGTKGEENGKFNHPRDMALDSQDRVYVLDTINNNQDRIQIFDINLKHIYSFMVGPSDPFCNGMTVSKRSGQIYLIGKEVQIFSPFVD